MSSSNCQVLFLSKIRSFFDDHFIAQKHGAAMGTKMAPQYANLFMAKLLPTYAHSQKPISISDMSMISSWFGRMSWPCQTFIAGSPNFILRLTSRCLQRISQCISSTVAYQWTKTTSKPLYRKRTDNFSLLKYSSFHPRMSKIRSPIVRLHGIIVTVLIMTVTSIF